MTNDSGTVPPRGADPRSEHVEPEADLSIQSEIPADEDAGAAAEPSVADDGFEPL